MLISQPHVKVPLVCLSAVKVHEHPTKRFCFVHYKLTNIYLYASDLSYAVCVALCIICKFFDLNG